MSRPTKMLIFPQDDDQQLNQSQELLTTSSIDMYKRRNAWFQLSEALKKRLREMQLEMVPSRVLRTVTSCSSSSNTLHHEQL